MTALLEHTNLTVADPLATAAWMARVFDWRIRWQGPAKDAGFTVHVGGTDSYLALYRPAAAPDQPDASTYATIGGLNHIAVVVADLDTTEDKVREAGFVPHTHADYEPGRRFYFNDDNDVEFEVVSYA